MGVSEQRAFEILNLKLIWKEKLKVNTTTGIIEVREVKDVTGRGGKVNQLISFTINGKKYSTFDNAVPGEVAERLGELKKGDEVELTYKENPGTWQGKAVTYLNIVDAVRVDRMGGEEAPKPRPTERKEDKPKKAGDSKPQDGSRDDMMRLSYAKDVVNAVLTRGHINPAEGESEELFLARVFSLIKAGAKTLGE